MVTVIPSICCLLILETLSLSGAAVVGDTILVGLPALVLIGGTIGYGTSVISPNKWLVVFGTQVGWFGGLLIVGLTRALFSIPVGGRLLSYATYALWICFGVLAGLVPALVARYMNGVK